MTSTRTKTSRAKSIKRNSRGRAVAKLVNMPNSMTSFLRSNVPKDVWALLCFMCAVLILLSFLTSSIGPSGKAINNFFTLGFGYSRYLFPVALAFCGARLLLKDKENSIAPGTFYSGLVLLFITTPAIENCFQAGARLSSSKVRLDPAGGYTGVIFGHIVSKYIGQAGVFIVYLFLFLCSLLLLSGNNLRDVFKPFVENWNKIKESKGSQYNGPISTLPEPEPEEGVSDLKSTEQNVSRDSSSKKEARSLNEHEFKVPVIEKKIGSKKGLPPLDILHRSGDVRLDLALSKSEGQVLIEALGNHGVSAKLTGTITGPSFTRFEIEIATGTKVSKVLALSKDIAYAMASPDVRILAPVPGKSAIGIEVPNKVRQLVTLGDLFASLSAEDLKNPLEVPIGKDIYGQCFVFDLSKAPHVLIAGATGAGKSSLINSLVSSLILRNSPESLRLMLIDPKRVELGQYRELPHLITDVVMDPRQAAQALKWVVKEMELRYELLSEFQVRDILSYRQLSDTYKGETSYREMPYLVVIIDELNDLMMVSAREVEDHICRIAQKARAVGIHLVVATQRPSVDVVTGVIKANIPARFAFAVSSTTDSRVVLDQPGAERLIGRGDMMVLSAQSSTLTRLQAPFISESEIKSLVSFWRSNSPLQRELNLTSEMLPESRDPSNTDDDLYEKAKELVIKSQLGSTSMLQRKLKIGFARAGRLMDLLEENGIVGPSEGSKPRDVLVKPEID